MSCPIASQLCFQVIAFAERVSKEACGNNTRANSGIKFNKSYSSACGVSLLGCGYNVSLASTFLILNAVSNCDSGLNHLQETRFCVTFHTFIVQQYDKMVPNIA